MMSNEILFFLHIAGVFLLLLAALKHSCAALSSYLALQLIMSNIFVLKEITLFGIQTTCSEVFIVSGMYGISLVREYYGRRSALWAIGYGFLLVLFFVLLAIIHMGYNSVESALVEKSFLVLFATTPRILTASVLSYVFSERMHLVLVRFFRNVLPLTTAETFALMIGQTVDTVSFTFLGLYGIVAHPWQIVIMSLITKSIVIFLSVPILTFIRRCIIPFDRFRT